MKMAIPSAGRRAVAETGFSVLAEMAIRRQVAAGRQGAVVNYLMLDIRFDEANDIQI
jgi:hypothetical protein